VKQKYFIYDGKRYNSGTIVVIKWCNNITHTVCNARATFVDYDTENKEYTVEIYGNKHIYTENNFFKVFCYIVADDVSGNRNISHVPEKHAFTDELNIDGLFIAWIWYVFIMAVGVIFYDRIAIWILASIIFFNYRKKKLKEAGYK
jgi:hypothetical protein